MVCSDASWPDPRDGVKAVKEARIGWVIFHPNMKPQGFSLKVNASITDKLIVRKQQIMAVEAFASVAALHTSPDLFKGSDVVWFVDNESAASSLIRGAARPEDIDKISVMASLRANRLRSRIWWEWIDSDSNPSDGLSRAGITDSWTLQQNWDLTDLGDVDWSFVFRDVDKLDFIDSP